MKKLLLIVTLFAVGFSTVNAQEEGTGGFENGDVYLSGTVGFSSFKQDEAKANNLAFSPAVGFFVSENIALELGLTVGSGENVVETKTNSFGGQLGATYFFTPANQFSFTLGAGLSYLSVNQEFLGGGELKNNTFAFAVFPGLHYFVSDCIALRGSIGALSYASSKDDVDGAEAANNFNINLDLSDFNFGVIYKF